MSLSEKQLESLLEIAKTAALKAGEIIKSYQGEKIEVLKKEGGENIASQVVTEVDLEAERAILKVLKPTFSEYKLGLLTEESPDDHSRFNHDYFWCIDPLDGTYAFSKNEDGHSTSIALVSKQGMSVIGVVYDPRQGNLYSAIKGRGAYKNNFSFKLGEMRKSVTLLFDRSYLNHPNYREHIVEIQKRAKGFGFKQLIPTSLGGAVMNGISTIELAPAIYYKLPKKAQGGGSLWDFAASSLIQQEANGFNSDYFKNPFDLNQKNTTFMNQKGVIFLSSKELLSLIPSLS